MGPARVLPIVERKRSKWRRILTWRRLVLVGVAVVSGLVAYPGFEARVARAFEAADASSPTRVLARPLVLRPDQRVSTSEVRAYLERVGYRDAPRGEPDDGEYRLRGREWLIGRRPLRIGPYFDPGGLARVRLDGWGRVRSIVDVGGRRLDGLVLDPEIIGTSLGPRGRDRVPVALEQLPPHLITTLLTVEDRRYREHGGFDPRRILGAALTNLRRGRLVEGGSTLTQQLARTLFLTGERTVFRKIREAAIAFALERRFSKERLLEAYLNHVYLGQDGGAAIHGVGRAAQFYFGKDASRLTLGESAVLVGIIRGPSLYSPHRHPERARGRRELVLRQLHEQGHIEDGRLATELEAPLRLAPAARDGLESRWYLDYLDRELALGTRLGEVGGRGLTIVGSLRPDLQRAAEAAVASGLDRLERAHPRLADAASPLQAALVAIDPGTGEIVAMVGGRSYAHSQFNRATDARRQPGSAFKPVVAMAALAGTADPSFTLASVIQDEPLRVETPAGEWTPSNADHEFLGPVRLREALEMSRNVPFARLGLAIGPQRIVRMGRTLGIQSPLAPVPALALGASEVTLLELTGVYGVFAAEGLRVAPHAVRSALGPDGTPLALAESERERVVSPAEAYLLTSALRGVVERGTGTGVRAAGYHGQVAAKSGTTNGSRDAWFVGYTPELAVGVWVGFDDGGPVGLSGSQAALPIFAGFLRRALGPEGAGTFRFPEGIEWIDVDPQTGLRAGWGCRGEPELFLAGTAPATGCGDEWGRWRDLRRLGSRALEDVERWLRGRASSGRRPVRIEGRSGGP